MSPRTETAYKAEPGAENWGRTKLIRQAETLLRFIQPRHPLFSIPHEFQEELPLVTPMGNVPGVSGNEISIGPRHGNQDDELALVIARHIIGFLNVSFRGQNGGPKPLKWRDIWRNSRYEKDLIWSDPGPDDPGPRHSASLVQRAGSGATCQRRPIQPRC